ncbi:MAG: hypothetical protein KA794_21175, partial [Candidatus Obscuribacter sp.]|nr:hypothetical protein [Candidatus Obscuribacter sp.]MBP7579242.1 hypothetical protein [Candidatus Obscuribacter sp.]
MPHNSSVTKTQLKVFCLITFALCAQALAAAAPLNTAAKAGAASQEQKAVPLSACDRLIAQSHILFEKKKYKEAFALA